MKCPTCESCEYAQYCGATEIMRKCERHNKKVEQTNEEWLHTLNTEQLAEWLSEKLDYCQTMWYWACDKCTWSKKHESCMNDKEKWEEWLKQPHTKGVTE